MTGQNKLSTIFLLNFTLLLLIITNLLCLFGGKLKTFGFITTDNSLQTFSKLN